MNFLDPLGVFKGLKGKDPSKGANAILAQIPGQMQPYYDPYINAGREAIPTLQEQYSQLLGDPGALMQKLAGGFQESPGYQFNLKNNLNAIENAAAAGGMTGTPQHQLQAGSMASGLANQEFYNYLNQIMQLYGQGLLGTQGLGTQGFQASDSLAQSLANNLMSQASLKYAGAVNKNQAKQGLMGAGLRIAGGLIGGGLGGPPGAMVGSQVGGMV